MRQILFYLILLANIFHIACSQNKKPISVEQIPSKYSTILFAEKNEIIGIRFYLAFDIRNNTNKEVNLSYPEYIYNGKFSKDLFKSWRTAIPIFSSQNDKLEPVFGNKNIIGLGKLDKISKPYIFVAGHDISQDSTIQSMFSSYLEKMKAENKDTLHIGTISELKAINSPILQMLEGDSLILSFGRNDLYIDPIPVQIK